MQHPSTFVETRSIFPSNSRRRSSLIEKSDSPPESSTLNSLCLSNCSFYRGREIRSIFESDRVRKVSEAKTSLREYDGNCVSVGCSIGLLGSLSINTGDLLQIGAGRLKTRTLNFDLDQSGIREDIGEYCFGSIRPRSRKYQMGLDLIPVYDRGNVLPEVIRIQAAYG